MQPNVNISRGFPQYEHDTHLEDARFLTRYKNQSVQLVQDHSSSCMHRHLLGLIHFFHSALPLSFPVMFIFYCMALVNEPPLISCQKLNAVIFGIWRKLPLIMKRRNSLACVSTTKIPAGYAQKLIVTLLNSLEDES